MSNNKWYQMANPDWVRDEVILALDLYFRDKSAIGNHSHPEVIRLSTFLNQLPLFPAEAKDKKFRNPNGVGMKLANFQRLDPTYSGKGLDRGNKLEKDVWSEFSHDKDRLRNTVAAIKAAYKTPGITATLQDYSFEEDEAPEGRILAALHKYRERSKKLVGKKKSQALLKFGKLECEACRFDFASFYGERGFGFIECRHDKPVSLLAEDSKTRLEDLRLVCANCHRIIHKNRPWLTVKELQEILNK